jgi:hypothetical protein
MAHILLQRRPIETTKSVIHSRPITNYFYTAPVSNL